MDVYDAQRQSRRRLLLLLGVLASVLTIWGLSRPDSEIDQTRRHFVELQRQVAAARDGKTARATDRGRVMRLRAQARAASGAQREAFEAEASTLEAGLAWGNQATVRAAALAAPLVALRRPSVSIAVADARAASVAPEVGAATSASGCVTCHVTVGAPGYEAYPSPFKTHPNLAAYVGSQSPHAASKMTCRQCHEGTESATTFQSAGHSTLDAARQNANMNRVWADATGENAMLPLTRTEAACVTCHSGEWFLPGATALNAAYVTYDRAGCYACHSWPGYDRTRKRGPDLRRVSAKLSPDWVRKWLHSPRSVKPATWMPDFWQSSDFGGDGRGEPEVAAIVSYLFSVSEAYSPAVKNPPAGDPVRGQQLVTSIGCLGCHTTDAGVGRTSAGLRRTFGPPLQALRGKVSHEWLFDWVSNPSQFSPTTQMPSLRLSAVEAADVAAYLSTLAGSPADDRAVAVPDDAFRKVARLHGQTASEITGRLGDDPDSLSGETLRIETGRRVIAALGCYQCHSIAGFEYTQPVQNGFRLGASIGDDEIANRLHVPPPGSDRLADARTQALYRRAPRYALQPDEASSLALAVTGLPRARGTGGTTSTRGLGRAVMQQRNCVGCHVMEGAGGDYVTLVTDPSLGPPLLTPEGSRVQTDWLRVFLREPKTIRPWLSVRMPTFALSTAETDQIGGYFRAVAAPNPRPPDVPAGVTATVGKELFELLKCQQCHVLGTIPTDQPTSNLAPDLRLSRERLQPDWILAWLQNPSAILPGTRMPTFWPDYPTSFYPPLDKQGAAQIRAIRDHVLTLR